MREIVMDTETTGLDPYEGHRLVEIGCVELVNHIPTGRTLHLYLNPERDVPPDAVAVHGLTEKFLADKPVFAEVFTDFLDFVGDSTLVIHNAEFDLKFLNFELRTMGHPGLKRNPVVDTLMLCRTRFPGSPATLDALCRRFSIDNSSRELHGALLDSQLLAEVYLELKGGRQRGLSLVDEKLDIHEQHISQLIKKRPYREPRQFPPSEAELAAHADLMTKLSDPLWKRFDAEDGQAA